MLVSSRLFNIIKTISIFLVLTASQGCLSEEKRLKLDSIQKPEELKLFVKSGVSKDRQKSAEKLYIAAIKRKKLKNNWGAVSKYFGETVLIYPTAKSLIGLSEAEAKFYTQIRFDAKVATMTLKSIENYLKGAIAVDSIQKKMTPSETEEVNSDIVCIGDFLKSRVKKDNCKYVNYVYKPKE